ncbi:DUF2625 domain-containing protein [Streptomyces sp. NPDC052225]|uniref:DUF2625 domain-containing protein n=1 Tax=Streptomyces sp. NPDC052225 TaxID=3154949 RepID=UPI0034167BA4
MRELTELIDVEDPAWPELRETVNGGRVPIEVLPPDSDLARASLLQLQVTAGSYLGAVVLHSGGLLIDHGWVRVFGSPEGESEGSLPSLARVNRFPEPYDSAWHPAAGLVVAHDVLNGVFALNGGNPAEAGCPGAPGDIIYFAPDTLRWESLGIRHSAWLTWLVSGALDEFYADLRWPGWQDDARALSGDQGVSLFPPLWSAEAHQNISATSRRTVPMTELLGIARDTCRQLDGTDPGLLG